MKIGYVYMMASKRNGTLYIGATSNLVQRVEQHKQSLMDGFTQKYNVKNLVWAEECASIEAAINREKQLKKWNRAWKLRLIESENPNWNDLSKEF